MIQDKLDNPGEPVLSHGKDLLEQPLDFYEPDVLPATNLQCQRTTGNQWLGRLLFYRHGISTPHRVCNDYSKNLGLTNKMPEDPDVILEQRICCDQTAVQYD